MRSGSTADSEEAVTDQRNDDDDEVTNQRNDDDDSTNLRNDDHIVEIENDLYIEHLE